MKVFVCAIAAAGLLGCGQRSPPPVRVKNASIVYRSLFSFSQSEGRLPEPGKLGSSGNILYSWRLSLMPYIERPKVDIDFEKPWDNAANSAVRKAENRVFANNTDGVPITFGVFGVGNTNWWGTTPLSALPPHAPLIVEWNCSLDSWTQPGDPTSVDVATLGDYTNLNHSALIVFTDGQTLELSPNTPMDILVECFTSDRRSHLTEYVVAKQ